MPSLFQTLSDRDRDLIVSRATTGLARAGVPMHLRRGLALYFSAGILPGSFLQAVLCNNLREAWLRGDPIARRDLFCIVDFLHSWAPIDSWGSRDKVLAWTVTPDRLEIQ